MTSSPSHTHKFNEADWPFDDAVNTATYITRHVLDGKLPVLSVFHEHDGDWQFLCGTTIAEEDIKLVCMGCVVERDTSLGDLADLPRGWCADRTAPGDPWVRDVFEEDDDDEDGDEASGNEGGEGEPTPRMTQPEFEEFVQSAMAELQVKQDRLIADYGFGDFARWFYDQQTEKMEMFDASDRKILEADIIDIGSFARNSNTWKWAWSNESVLPAMRVKAEPLKELEEIAGRRMFTAASAFLVDQECLCWELTAVSVRQLNAVGAYRAPGSDGRLNTFLAITAIRRV